MRVAPAVRIGLTVFGLIVVIGTFAGVTVIGTVTNPPPLRIAVAARDLLPGERIEPGAYQIEPQVINPNLARLYVQEADLSEFDSAFVADVIRRGDPLNKAKLATGRAASNRYALVLTDTTDVVMTLPVNPDVIPSGIAAGDMVNLLFAAGAEVGLNRLPDPTETPFAASYAATAVPPPDNGLAPTVAPTVTATPVVVLPLADLMLEQVPVLDVNYEQVRNPNFGSGDAGNERPYIDGPITSIVVRVPRGYQALLGFAAVSGRLRFAIASPLAQATQAVPGAGVDWKTYIDAYRWKVQQSIQRGETLTQTLYPLYVPPTAVPTSTAIPDLPVVVP